VCLLQVLASVDAAVAEHVANHSAHFNGRPLVTWRSLEEPLKIRLQVGVTYSFSGEVLVVGCATVCFPTHTLQSACRKGTLRFQ
jgi:hypothetical protein